MVSYASSQKSDRATGPVPAGPSRRTLRWAQPVPRALSAERSRAALEVLLLLFDLNYG